MMLIIFFFQELFEVEKILESRLGENGREYLVKWATNSAHNESPEHTWEPEEHVQHLELFQEFHRKLLEKNKRLVRSNFLCDMCNPEA